MRLNRDDQRKAPRQASRVPVRHSSRTSELPTMAPSFRLKHYWNTVLDWLYPGSASVCVLCNRAIPAISEQQGMHISVWADVPESLGQLVCPFCLQEARDIRPRPIRQSMRVRMPGNELRGNRCFVSVPVFSVFRYEGFVQRAIRPWKYDGALALTEWFSSALVSAITVANITQAVDGIVPVPTAPERLRQRGYHHTLLLAKSVAATCHLPVWQVLERGKQTEHQSETEESGRETQTAKSARERRASLVGAFHTVSGLDIYGTRILFSSSAL